MTRNHDEIEILIKQAVPMQDVDCIFWILVRPSFLPISSSRQFETADEGPTEFVQPDIFRKTESGHRCSKPAVCQWIVWMLSQQVFVEFDLGRAVDSWMTVQ